MIEEQDNKYIGKFLETDYEKFQHDFLNLLKDYKRKTQRLDKIIKQSDKQQFQFLQMNEELEEYKKKLENKIKNDKILFQNQRLSQMGEVISMIAHQWRQPLATISSTIISMQINQNKLEDSILNNKELKTYFDKQEEKYTRITGQVQILSKIIDEFRTFFQPNDEKKETTSLSQLVSKALVLKYPDINNSGIKIINHHFGDTINLLVHANEIVQVLLNILQNSEDNFNINNILSPQIIISSGLKNNNAFISILDNGGGIPEDIIDKVFDPYYSTKDKKNGTGIGLYMSKMIIEEHNNGYLSCFNTQDGVCFEIIWKSDYFSCGEIDNG